ncbi:hypothetical protein CXG81DRAFT_17237 [Caulochytrium protostelioides]|uniref:ubiquitinyl hydrolase 1 n=1 Tax=Caulochytrium protostelioides TaxID=1555241 RepID=A0A4P9XCM3_9FUNG|nr:hypothetical protein CXG81DRAFT_17237 [Caulochytrium protostelioides]|eukprot:RKP03172.1 hypothetical protein CXG81DRAFT_17237 [Caulochytrium protostelioides]
MEARHEYRLHFGTIAPADYHLSRICALRRASFRAPWRNVPDPRAQRKICFGNSPGILLAGVPHAAEDHAPARARHGGLPRTPTSPAAVDDDDDDTEQPADDPVDQETSATTPVEDAEPPKEVVPEDDASRSVTEAHAAAEEPAPPAPKPKPKPASWAALVAQPTAGDAAAAAGTGGGTQVDALAAAPPLPLSARHADTLFDYAPDFQNAYFSPRGLVNPGTLCFLNVILQPLLYCAPFYNLYTVLREVVPPPFEGTSPTPLTDAMLDFIAEFPPLSAATLRTRGAFTDAPSMGAAGSASLANGTRRSAASTTATSSVPAYASTTAHSDMQHAMQFDLAAASRAASQAPGAVYAALRTYQRIAYAARQEDAQEFLGFLLDGLHEELRGVLTREAERTLARPPGQRGALSPRAAAAMAAFYAEAQRTAAATGQAAADPATVASADGERQDDDGDDDGWHEIGRRNRKLVARDITLRDTPVSTLFFGRTRSVISGPGFKDRVTTEPFITFPLDLSDPPVTSIEDALRSFAQPECVEGFTTRAGAVVDLVRSNRIGRVPPVFILHLKRFHFDGATTQKINRWIAFPDVLTVPPETLSPQAQAQLNAGPARGRLQLAAVIYHQGKRAEGGHYTCDVRVQGGTWLTFNDTQVTRTTLKAIMTESHERQVYLLIYTLRTT